jgi:hypothetical protein
MSGPIDEQHGQRQWPWMGLLIGLVTVVVFSGAATHGFLEYDDIDYLTDNPLIRRGLTLDGLVAAFTTFQVVNWSPITVLSHMLDVSLFGMEAGLHHLMSVALHAATAWVLFNTWRSLSGSSLQALLVASLFAIHPLRVESVAWASERKDVLCALFCVLTIAAHARAVARPRFRNWLLMTSCGALALLSKPMAVTLPFVLLLLDVWPLGRTRVVRSSLSSLTPASAAALRPWPWLVIEKVPLLLMAVGVSLATVVAQRTAMRTLDALPVWVRLENAVVAVTTYLRQCVWPSGLAVLVPLPPGGPPVEALVTSVVVVVAMTVAALWSRRPALIIGWLFFLGTLTPVLGLVQVGLQASADRYTYIPSIGLGIMVADLASLVASRSRRHRHLVLVVFGCIMAASAVGTVKQVDLWRSQSVLFGHAVAVTGPNPTARAILASALLQEHRAAEAIVHASEAVRLSPIDDHVDLLGRTLVAVGQLERAIQLLTPLCARQTPHVASCVHLGEALLGAGDVVKAREAAARASATAPGVSEVELLVAQTHLASPDANPVLALRSAKSAMQRLDDRADAHAMTVFAEALAANAQRADALRVIDIALDVAAGEGDDISSKRLTTLRATLVSTPP